MTRKAKVVLAVAGVGLVTALLLGYFLWYAPNHTPSVLHDAASKAAFPLYEPSALPDGYVIDPESISLTSEALLFSASNNKGEKLIFTETPVSQEFDFESFYKEQYVGMQDVQSVYGRGTIGVIDNAMSGSLVATSTWVLVTGTKDMASSTMADVIRNLKPITVK